MKIAMITSWQRECGIYSYTRPLVEELRRQGHEVEVVCHSDVPASPHVHPVMDLVRPDWPLAVQAAAAAIRPDVVHVQFEYGLYATQQAGWPTAAAAFGLAELLFRWKIAGQPAVVTMHSDNSDRPDRLAFIETLGRLATINLVHTEFGPVPSGKVAFMPHAAPPAKPASGAKERFGWQGKTVVGMIGYPDWYKRYDRIVRLWPDIAARLGAGAQLVVACAPRPGSQDGEALAALLAAAIESCPARDSIVDLSRLFSPDEFVTVIAAFDVLVLPYASAAASGPSLAAAAAGTPVVASRVGGLRSYVEDSGAGLAVPKDDDAALVRAIVRLGRNQALRGELSLKARRYARRVSQPNIARRHVTLYRWAMAHTRSLAGAPSMDAAAG